MQLSSIHVSDAASVRVRECLQIAECFFLSTNINAKGNVMKGLEVEPIRYLEKADLSNKASDALNKLQPGTTRDRVGKTWTETGGFVPCQFLLLEKEGGPEFVAVRIEWRPAAMPERIFSERNLRAKWIRRNAPLPSPDDVAMRISRPYLARYVVD